MSSGSSFANNQQDKTQLLFYQLSYYSLWWIWKCMFFVSVKAGFSPETDRCTTTIHGYINYFIFNTVIVCLSSFSVDLTKPKKQEEERIQ